MPVGPPAWSTHELVVAPATVSGPGCRSIVRFTGDGLAALLPRLFVPRDEAWGGPRSGPRAVAARLAGELADDWGPLEVDVLFWPGPAGPVGGPLAEVQLPASPVLVTAVVEAACRHGCRLARGGEFTLRAFLAGRLDLDQAEAVLAVVEARTPEELSSALDRLAGGAGGRLDIVRERLLDLLADIEAAVDFADESIPDAVPAADAATFGRIRSGLAVAAVDLDELARGLAARDAGAAERPRVVLVGRPNIGKSSLFNALVGRAAALVADEWGTTRDWLEASPMEADGAAPYTLVDLPGVAAAGERDAVMAAAAAAAAVQIETADVIVACRDAGDEAGPDVAATAPRIDVATRCDRGAAPRGCLATSVVTGAGLGGLRTEIASLVATLPRRPSAATTRLAAGVAAAAAAVRRAIDLAAAPPGGRDEIVIAIEVRRAVDALAEVTGRDIATALVDRIFSRHCIGK